MNFCPTCGARVEARVPEGDDRQRSVCTSCGAIHYVNPRVVVGCIVEHEDALLLCRRAIEPAHGLWTPPAGYLEVGESAAEGARREAREEANVEIEIVAPHSWLDLPHIGQVYHLFRGRLARPGFSPGAESLEVALIPVDEVPWDELAFPVLHFALRAYVADRAAGRHRLHAGSLEWSGQGSRFDPANYTLRDGLRLPE